MMSFEGEPQPNGDSSLGVLGDEVFSSLYTGDEDAEEDETPDATARASAILARIHKQAEDRKRHRDKASRTNTEEATNDRKQTKYKPTELIEDKGTHHQVFPVSETDDKECVLSKLKKSKRKRTSSSGSAAIDQKVESAKTSISKKTKCEKLRISISGSSDINTESIELNQAETAHSKHPRKRPNSESFGNRTGQNGELKRSPKEPIESKKRKPHSGADDQSQFNPKINSVHTNSDLGKNKQLKLTEKNGIVSKSPSLSEDRNERKKMRTNAESVEVDTSISEQLSDSLSPTNARQDIKGSDVSNGSEKQGEEEGEEEPDALKSKDKQQSHEEVGGFTVIGDVKEKRIEKVHRVLPEWLRIPSIINADIQNVRTPLGAIKGLDADLIETLRENDIKDFFPVQAQVIPALLDSLDRNALYGKGGYRPSDICCSAPTGSGKTLAFVLPVIQALRSRVVRQVRALAVLPVRDLATQVYKVFQTYVKNTNLKVGLVIGQKTFVNEQQSLVRLGHRGYQSLVDIIVATPGRLVDHVNKTPGFNLKHLRFLLIDEADRMMDEISQDWLTQVERAVYQSSTGNSLHRCQRPWPEPITAANSNKIQIPLQKLLFSATLSQNPEKLQQMNLFQPKLFTSVVKNESQEGETSEKQAGYETGSATFDPDVSQNTGDFVGKYTTPSGLSEYFVESTQGEKPLVVLYLLQTLKYRSVLCFTNSLETTHTLCLLLRLVGGIEVQEYSAGLRAKSRDRLLRDFTAGKTDILICSDAMARGMDVENVQYVISYEAPPHLKTYIHRVGRTARAGRKGTAITLLERKDIFHFKKICLEVGKSHVEELEVTEEDLKPLVESYQCALQKLPAMLKKKKRKSRVSS